MAYLQGNILSPNREFGFSLKDFSGGLNNRSEILSNNEASDLLNMMFTNGAIMEKRKGQKAVKSLSTTSPITYMDEFSGFESLANSAKWGQAIWGERFSYIADHDVIATDKELFISDIKVTNVKSKIEGTPHQRNYYFVDGDRLKVYGRFPIVSSTYIDIIGTPSKDNEVFTVVSPPDDYRPLGDTFITVKAVREYGEETHVLVGSYWYVVELRDRQTAEDIIVNMKYFTEFVKYEGDDFYHIILYTEQERRDSQLRHIEGVLKVDYNNKQIWYEPSDMELEDEYKGANVVPRSTKYIVSHKGRLFTAGDRNDDDNIFISDVENPYYFPVSLPVQIPPDSDKIHGLAIYDDSVIVGRENDIYALSGETNRLDLGLELFHIRKLNTHTGFASSTCSNHVHNYLFFIGADGNAYALSSSDQEYRVPATQLINHTIDFTKDPINVSYEDISNVSTYFHDDYWYVSFGDKTLIYSYRHKAWTMFDGLSATSFHTLDNELHWGNGNGDVVTSSDDYLDFGDPYNCFWSSKFFDVDEPFMDKHFKKFNVVVEQDQNLPSNLSVNIDVNHFTNHGEVSLTPRNPKGNTFKNITHMKSYMINKRGRNIRFTLSDNGLNQPMKAYELNFNYEFRGGNR